ncbi:MAG: peptidylprolyl isomerase [Gammaproteobacteria bacterium]|nr:peptidylprolyl isomerase [Gammaproteobacteria bacterium]
MNLSNPLRFGFRYLVINLSLIFILLPLNSHAKQVVELDRIIAVVDDQVITRLELQRRIKVVESQLKENKVKLPPNSVLKKQVLERMIVEQVMLQTAKRRGIRVSDESINRYISSIAQEKKLSLDQFRKVLQKDGFTFAEFRTSIRDSMILERLKQQFVEKEVKISRQEVDTYLSKSRQGKQTEYKLAHILIGVPEAATPDQIDKAQKKAAGILQKLNKGADFAQTATAISDGQQALKGGSMGWLKAAQLPALYLDVIEKLKPGGISELIRSPGGFHILKLVKTRSKGNRHIVKQTLSRHILIKPTTITPDEKARIKLQKLRQRILAGEDFTKLARKHSDDKGSATQGGSLGWTGPGVFVPEFEKQLNKLKQGEISPVFRSPFGWHIIQLMSRRKHDDTEEYQRLQIKKQIHQRKANEAIENWMRRMRDEAYVEYLLDN